MRIFMESAYDLYGLSMDNLSPALAHVLKLKQGISFRGVCLNLEIPTQEIGLGLDKKPFSTG